MTRSPRRLAADSPGCPILSARFPVLIDGVPVIHAHRLGGRPSPLPLDPGDKRYELTC